MSRGKSLISSKRHESDENVVESDAEIKTYQGQDSVTENKNPKEFECSSCPVCFENFADTKNGNSSCVRYPLENCGHSICELCREKMKATGRPMTCPQCRVPMFGEEQDMSVSSEEQDMSDEEQDMSDEEQDMSPYEYDDPDDCVEYDYEHQVATELPRLYPDQFLDQFADLFD